MVSSSCERGGPAAGTFGTESWLLLSPVSFSEKLPNRRVLRSLRTFPGDFREGRKRAPRLRTRRRLAGVARVPPGAPGAGSRGPDTCPQRLLVAFHTLVF